MRMFAQRAHATQQTKSEKPVISSRAGLVQNRVNSILHRPSPFVNHAVHGLLQAETEDFREVPVSNSSTPLGHSFSRISVHAEGTRNKKENEIRMPSGLEAGIENISGVNMGDVRVHYNSIEPAKLRALAYTQGTDIHVRAGQERHLPHEAWHVVQQKQGRVAPTAGLKGMSVNNDEVLEHEADQMGARAARYSAAFPPIVPSP